MRIRFHAIAAAALLALSGTAHAAAPISGRWLTEDGTSIVTVGPCSGQAAKQCARITKLVGSRAGEDARDRKNPKKALRSQSLVGLQVLWGLEDAGDTWKGQGYSHDHGVYFRVQVSREGTRLKVRGCKAIICQSSYWTKAP